ncbi:MAG: transaldolase [Candidatus Coatesbacteria bacterium]
MARDGMEELARLGQSVWLDNINRSLIASGRLRALVSQGLRGLTSNPSIFDAAVASGKDYDSLIASLKGKTAFEVYDALSIRDIRDAADAFSAVHRSSNGLDGYVSLEIDPRLARDTSGTVAEGLRLVAAVGRPNLMVKVPATDEGFPAIERLIAQGINVNVTLIFSLEQYERCARAYLDGVKKCSRDPRSVRSVASVFVSRIDTAADPLLAAHPELKGTAAIANSAVIYARYRELFFGTGWGELARGTNPQRVLWGSTGTKDPAYPDTKYVAGLAAKDTINTIPEKTLQAFLDHGVAVAALGPDATEARAALAKIAAAGVDIDAITAKLLADGVAAFVKSFEHLLATIEAKAQ